MNLDELLQALRNEKDWQDELNGNLAKSKAKADMIEAEIVAKMKEAGLDNDGAKVSANGMTVTLRHKFRAAYDPAKWSQVVKWAVDTGHEYIIQRRLSDKPVLELMDNGTPLPDGLSVTSYEDLDFRRS